MTSRPMTDAHRSSMISGEARNCKGRRTKQESGTPAGYRDRAVCMVS